MHIKKSEKFTFCASGPQINRSVQFISTDKNMTQERFDKLVDKYIKQEEKIFDTEVEWYNKHQRC